MSDSDPDRMRRRVPERQNQEAERKEEVGGEVLKEINGTDDKPNKRHQEKDAPVVGARFAQRRFGKDIGGLQSKACIPIRT